MNAIENKFNSNLRNNEENFNFIGNNSLQNSYLSDMKNFIIIATFLLLANCKKEDRSYTKENFTTFPDSIDIVKNDSIVLNKEDVLKKLNDEILESLNSKNYAQFSQFIHPKKGVTFSMYSYVEEDDKKFSRSDFERYISTNTKFTWGEQDGTGDLLVVPIREYLEDHTYTKDFTKSKYYFNEFKGSGNSINNIKKTYPDLNFTENYIAGSEKYGGMDWKSLIFVWEKLNDKYYIVAMVKNSWTI